VSVPHAPRQTVSAGTAVIVIEAMKMEHEVICEHAARENLAGLLDPDSFVEYGRMMFAAQERRRSREELIERTPADGLVGGVGAIAGESCGRHADRRRAGRPRL
jgi:acetyl-CoA carboxylase carboxyltransferase component